MAHVVPAAAGSAPPRPTRRSKTGYLLLFPGIAWLAVFFAIPLVTLFATSLQVPIEGKTGKYKPGLDFSNYSQALADYWPQFLRSFMYAGLATLLALVIAYPLAYFIAFKSGKWRSLLLVLVIAPSFASFLLRTYAWKTILADDGFVTSTLNTLHLLPEGRILNTWIAVVAGLTYNFLPFMVLPLYAALERIDHRFIEAAGDLYASPQTAFRKVTWPLSMPGVVAGTLLTFIPAAGDYINSELLGSPRNRMIGNEIQANFIEYRDYPAASAMSFMLMAVILVLVFVYIRRAGTEDLV
ncbi:MAG: ABC transporter permease [Candidatus Nanopelagicales bacterium]|jgi:spermidine/putrescine transport system permease protein